MQVVIMSHDQLESMVFDLLAKGVSMAQIHIMLEKMNVVAWN